jgi:hypothetical protein
MYELAEYGVLELHEENGREVAMKRPRSAAREDHRKRPYVVRDLSWELARFLDAEDLPAAAFDTPGGANGNTLQPE